MKSTLVLYRKGLCGISQFWDSPWKKSYVEQSVASFTDQREYHFDYWMRKRQWWWSFFFWATGVLLVNTYISYKTYIISKGMQPMTHYEFCKAIALAWLDPSKHWHNRMKNRNKSGASLTTTSGNRTIDTVTSSIPS